eukprot:11576245-Alexandrium_andersonii.AAC.1
MSYVLRLCRRASTSRSLKLSELKAIRSQRMSRGGSGTCSGVSSKSDAESYADARGSLKQRRRHARHTDSRSSC